MHTPSNFTFIIYTKEIVVHMHKGACERKYDVAMSGIIQI